MMKKMDHLLPPRKYGKTIRVFFVVASGFCFLREGGFLRIKNQQIMKAPQNDSDPSNQSFFNFRKQSKYEKSHDGEIYGYLWIIQCRGISMSQGGVQECAVTNPPLQRHTCDVQG